MTATEWFMKAQIEQLEKENKSLKEKVSELEDISKDYDVLSKDFITATGEIEFWKDEVERFKQNAMADMKEITDLEIENKKLKEKIQTLELWLDNKEKLNEEYRKQIDKLKLDGDECYHAMIFENDEVWYWKRECKKLKAELDKYKDDIIYEEWLYD